MTNDKCREYKYQSHAYGKAVEAMVEFRSANGTHWSLEALQVFAETYEANRAPEVSQDVIKSCAACGQKHPIGTPCMGQLHSPDLEGKGAKDE